MLYYCMLKDVGNRLFIWRKKGNLMLSGVTVRMELTLQGPGTPVSVLASGVPRQDAGGRVTGAIIVMSDISARKADEARVAWLATHDSLTGLLNQALGTQLQFVEQTPQGTVILRGYQGGSLAFVPYNYQNGDNRANGIYALGDGRFQVVVNGNSLTIAPALAHLDQLVALLPGVQVVQGENGVMTAYVAGVTYVVQPSLLVQAGAGTGVARLVLGSDGHYHFIDAQGNEQILYPAFREPSMLRAALLQIDLLSSLSINLDGTATVQVLGRGWTLAPDLILTPVPIERLGQLWWQEQVLRYYYANAQFQPVAGMAQGLTAR